MGPEALPGVKQLGREADHEPSSTAEVKNMSTALVCLQSVKRKLLLTLAIQ
jgi:hypothetical protein